MTNYQLLLLTSDGSDYVTEKNRYGNNSINDCEVLSSNMGSKWFFYPYHFIIIEKNNNSELNKQRVIKAPHGLEFLKNKSIKTVRNFLKKYGNELLENFS